MIKETDSVSETVSDQLTTSAGNPIADNQNSLTAGPRGPLLLQDYQLIEKLAHQNRERIPERGAREGLGRLRHAHDQWRHFEVYQGKIAATRRQHASRSTLFHSGR